MSSTEPTKPTKSPESIVKLSDTPSDPPTNEPDQVTQLKQQLDAEKARSAKIWTGARKLFAEFKREHRARERAEQQLAQVLWIQRDTEIKHKRQLHCELVTNEQLREEVRAAEKCAYEAEERAAMAKMNEEAVLNVVSGVVGAQNALRRRDGFQ